MDVKPENCPIRFFEKFLHEFIRWYPIHPHAIVFLNTPGPVNFVMGLWQRYLRPEVKGTIKLGHKIPGLEGQRLDPLYQTPTPEIARQHLLENVREFLQRRYKNERKFRLPERG